MSETIERIIFFIIGCGFGGILGYIAAYLRFIRAEVHEVHEELHHHDKDEAGILQSRVATNISFIVMMIFVLYAVFASFQNDKRDEENQEVNFKNVCVAAEDIRTAQRDTVEAVYVLLIAVLENDEDVKPGQLTDAQLREVNKYIDNANAFRKDAYSKIQPSEACLPYVEDDNVKPNGPPYPQLK
jgi:predicted histidine transporter YuiF (NhaC family)